MTTAIDLLEDAFGRIKELVGSVLEDAGSDLLLWRPDPEANSVGWLVWHLTRVQDHHIVGVAGSPQVWSSGGWADTLGIPHDDEVIGYGMSPEEVGAVRPASATLLSDYHDAVHERTTAYLRTLTEADLDRVVDERWDPPVTLGVRLLSIVGDDLQHAGQASYVAGLFRRRTS